MLPARTAGTEPRSYVLIGEDHLSEYVGMCSTPRLIDPRQRSVFVSAAVLRALADERRWDETCCQRRGAPGRNPLLGRENRAGSVRAGRATPLSA